MSALDPLDQDWDQISTSDSWSVPSVYQFGARELVSRELYRLAAEMDKRPGTLDSADVRARAEQLRSAVWCNCQAIPGTVNFPGPWHERGRESHYQCVQKAAADVS